MKVKKVDRAFEFFLSVIRLSLLCTLLLVSISALALNGCKLTAENNGPATKTKELHEYLNAKVPADIIDGFSRGFIVQVQRSMPVRSFVGSGTATVAQRELTSINGFTAWLTVEELKSLLADPNVMWIAPDRETRVSGFVNKPGFVHVTTGADQVVIPKNFKGKFEGITGNDVYIAVLDSGVKKKHGDLDVKKTEDFTGLGDKDKDLYGHGTHVSGLANGSGKRASEHKYAKYHAGIAPGAKTINLKVLDKNGAGYVSDVIAAIDWLLEKDDDKLRVINLSLGVPPMSSYKTDPLAVACATAVQAGIVVVAAAGNFGDFEGQAIYGGIMSPAYSPYVIAVGAADTNGTPIRSDDTVADFSSKGPTLFDGLPKPDLVAPGTDLKAPVSLDGNIYTDHPETGVNPCVEIDPNEENYDKCDDWNIEYEVLSGTSMSAPIVAGTVALMLEVNPTLTPNAVKAILMATAQNIPNEPYVAQGAGLLNVEGAVRLAGSIKDPQHAGHW